MALSPLALLSLVRDAPPRPFVVEFSVALGFAGFMLAGMQFVLPARARPLTRAVGADVLMRAHRQAGVVAGLVVAGHVALLMLDDPARLALLDPLSAPTRAKAGVVSLAAFCALIASSLWRRRLALPYERWRLLHLALGAAALGAGLLHVVGVGRYLHDPTVRIHTAAVVAVGAVGAGYLRLVRPRRIARRPYRVRGVRRERGDATTIVLEPVGHPGHPFRHGQFAWLRVAGAAHSRADNPFSIASSAARPGSLEFTIKAVGDFTRRVAELRPGAVVMLDGPHGSYRPALPHAGFVLVVAGIGITPAMSLLRTLADERDRRPVLLVYGSRRWDGVIFREELERLKRRLDLRVVHVLSDPHDAWRGERGRIDAPLLDRVWPEGGLYNVLVCGSAGMVASTYDAVRRRGVPRRLIHVEGFAP